MRFVCHRDGPGAGRSASHGAVRALAAFALLVCPLPLRAQNANALGSAAWSHMHMVLEKTIFQVDVLMLDVCLNASTAARVATLAPRAGRAPAADSIARAVLAASHASARIRILRDLAYGRFLSGMSNELQHAAETGFLADTTFRSIRASLPDWYSFLENRDLHDGDQILYRFRADSLRVTYIAQSGDTLMTRSSIGRERRNSVLATWFARGSSFRKRLLESLNGSAGEPASPACDAHS